MILKEKDKARKRKREREREIETEKEKEKKTERERERERASERERERDRERIHKAGERDTHIPQPFQRLRDTTPAMTQTRALTNLLPTWPLSCCPGVRESKMLEFEHSDDEIGSVLQCVAVYCSVSIRTVAMCCGGSWQYLHDTQMM